MKKGSFRYVLKELKTISKTYFSFFQAISEQWLKNAGLYEYQIIEEVIKTIPSKKVNLVGHSLGGLESLIYTLNNPEKVENCVSIGSPISGTNYARFGSFFNLFNIKLNCQNQLYIGSQFMEDFGKRIKEEIPKFKETKIINIWSSIDELIDKNNSSFEKSLYFTSDNLIEYEIPTGHGDLFYCNFTQKLLKDLIKKSDNYTLLIHGLSINHNFFKPFIKKLDKKTKQKIITLNYDYTKKLMI